MNTNLQKQTPALLSSPHAERTGEIILRKKKRRLPIRIIASVLIILGIISIVIVALGKIADGSVENMIFGKLSGFLLREDSTFAPPITAAPNNNDIPVAVPPSSEREEETSNLPLQTSPPFSESLPPVTSQPTTDIPSGAFLVKDAEIPTSAQSIENLTGRHFDIEYLEAMKSTLLRAEGDAPVCLIIHTHATEGYLSEGTKYYHPSSGELARSGLDSENIVSVGKALADTLNKAGIHTLHVTVHHDEKGAGTAYINSINTISAYLSKYPSIKYVFDIHRSSDTADDGSIIRDSLKAGNNSLARIRLTVSGGPSLESSSVNANLSLALKLNALLCDYSSSLSHPVRISDAVYCDGFAPRTLKIDIGSCASTLQEARESAKILGEAIASLLI